MSLLALSLLCLSSCGSSTAKVIVRNNKENNTTTISVKTGEGGDTHVNVAPHVLDSVQVNYNPKSY